MQAEQRGSAPALVADGTAVSYEHLAERAARCAGMLRARGVSTGDRVGVMLPNGPEFVALLYGAWMLGAVVVPLNVLLAQPEVASTAIASTTLLIRDVEELEARRAAAGVTARDPVAPGGHPVHVGNLGSAQGCDADTRQYPRRGDERCTGAPARLRRRRARRRAVLACARSVDGIVSTLLVGRRDRRRAPLRRAGDARAHDRGGRDGPARGPDDVHRAVRGGTHRRAAAAVRIAHVGGAAVPARSARLRADVRGRRLRGLRDDGDVRHRDDLQCTGRCESSARSGCRSAGPEIRIGEARRARRRRGALSRAVGDPRLLGRHRRRPRRRSRPTAGSRRATWDTSTTTAICSSSTARRR